MLHWWVEFRFLLIGCSDTPEEKRMKELKQQVAKEKLQQTTAI